MNEAENNKNIEGWAEPPLKAEPRYDWGAISTKLKRSPNKWALVFTGDRTSLSVAIKIGHISALKPEKGFQVRTANNTKDQPRTCDLYLRYRPDLDTTTEGK